MPCRSNPNFSSKGECSADVLAFCISESCSPGPHPPWRRPDFGEGFENCPPLEGLSPYRRFYKSTIAVLVFFDPMWSTGGLIRLNLAPLQCALSSAKPALPSARARIGLRCTETIGGHLLCRGGFNSLAYLAHLNSVQFKANDQMKCQVSLIGVSTCSGACQVALLHHYAHLFFLS